MNREQTRLRRCHGQRDFSLNQNEKLNAFLNFISFQGFDYKTCSLMSCLEQQSPNIADGVHVNRSDEDIGAGDQVQKTRQNCRMENVR